MQKIVAVSLDELNYGELEILEEIIGYIPTTEEELRSVPKSKLLIACGYITALRQDPTITLADVKAMPVGSIVFGEESDPTDPAVEN